jgi:hypothetical protein
LGRDAEAREALIEASRFAADVQLAGEPALELQLARALVHRRAGSGAEWRSSAEEAVTALKRSTFQPVRLRVVAEELRGDVKAHKGH